ncbi:hypothetical protein BCR43DRAFT_483648 [Syncephalastrum racemosum]|uniref:Uncharacterized protein n=1 Tax=Syncephalastrum racemosum TaxID=13706 RepID=A0A1X2HVR5_SYNRA|nr:hypothetical protein BCR43DRAFT_483648 [Syncephalastrum racemosum]
MVNSTRGHCPRCNAQLHSFQINVRSYFVMCSDLKCPYPFDEPDAAPFLSNQRANRMSAPPVPRRLPKNLQHKPKRL